MTLPEIYFNPKQIREMAPITAAKKKTEDKKERGKKKSKVKKPKAVGHFLVQKLSQNFDFCACLGQNVLNAILVARTAS